MSSPAPSRDMAQLRARRRHARSQRRLARLDVGIGLLAAIVLLLAASGLAIAALLALGILLLCGLSIVLERRLTRPTPRMRRARLTRR